MRTILALALLCSCATTGQPVTFKSAVDCGTRAVAAHAVDALPAVNSCLAGSGDVVACLLGLVSPAAGITADTVACVVRHEGSAANGAAQANPGNAVDARRAARAREFVQRAGVTFVDAK